MRLLVATVGRVKPGAERELAERYLDRATKAGRAVGLTRMALRELSESRAGQAFTRRAEEAGALLRAVPDGAVLVALDEAGESLPSAAFAARLGRWRDGGASEVVFAIGGPDGHGDAIRARADLLLSLGAMTWPHQLVRILLAEQIYRAVTILAGHPYHRG